ncbi:MAG: hypothetical protein FJZ75_10605 [Bacteroidetes bacterium]|nr:hypothetical protein [Bacteroidota bacterium]
MIRTLTSVLLTIGLAFSTFGCYEEPTPGTVIVTVLDSQGFKVSEAEVRFIQTGNGAGIVDVTKYSNAAGEVSYTHTDPISDLPLEVVLNVSGKKADLVGQTVVRIIPGETTREILQLYN